MLCAIVLAAGTAAAMIGSNAADAGKATVATGRPNILFILADGMCPARVRTVYYSQLDYYV